MKTTVSTIIAILLPYYTAQGWLLVSRPIDGGWEVGSAGAPQYHEERYIIGDDGSVCWAGEQDAGDQPMEVERAIRELCWPNAA